MPKSVEDRIAELGVILKMFDDRVTITHYHGGCDRFFVAYRDHWQPPIEQRLLFSTPLEGIEELEAFVKSYTSE